MLRILHLNMKINVDFIVSFGDFIQLVFVFMNSVEDKAYEMSRNYLTMNCFQHAYLKKVPYEQQTCFNTNKSTIFHWPI